MARDRIARQSTYAVTTRKPARPQHGALHSANLQAFADQAQQADASPQVAQLKAIQALADRPVAAASPPLQRQPVIQRAPGVEVDLEHAKDRYEPGRKLWRRRALIRSHNTIADAIKLREIMRDLDGQVPAALRQLESDINEQLNLSESEIANTRHLRRALAVREKQCGLDPTKAIYTGILSSQDFVAESGKGALFDDYGAIVASFAHGEFTHRIQWYVLMFAMSDGFRVDIASEAPEGFNYTPKDLLININLADISFENVEMPQGSGMNAERHNMWDVLFDRPGLSVGSNDADNTDIGISDPERFMTMMAAASSGQKTAAIHGRLKDEAPELSRILDKRQSLRKKQMKSDERNEKIKYLDVAEYRERKLGTGRYTQTSRQVLVRNKPQSLVGRKGRGLTHVPYATDVEI